MEYEKLTKGQVYNPVFLTSGDSFSSNKHHNTYFDVVILFTGSDILYATRSLGGKKFPTKWTKYLYFLGMTFFAKLSDFFVERFYVVSPHLISELAPLKLRERVSVLVDPPQDVSMIEKKPHEGFNVLYYRGLGGNQKFKDWVYGKDIVDELKKRLAVNIIEVNGNSDMKEIYPIVDFYVRPNRHDGMPRMIKECEKLNIPYYWSKENPDIDTIERMVKGLYIGIS